MARPPPSSAAAPSLAGRPRARHASPLLVGGRLVGGLVVLGCVVGGPNCRRNRRALDDPDVDGRLLVDRVLAPVDDDRRRRSELPPEDEVGERVRGRTTGWPGPGAAAP